MTRQLVYPAATRDATSRLPVVVIDSTVLSDGRLPDSETEVPAIISALPSESEFVIVFFASRAPKTPQVSWLRRVHGSLSRDLKKRIRKVYIVHAKWYTRALNKAVAPIVSPKFAKKTVFIKNLTELSHYMDITAIDINPTVYFDDIERSSDMEIDPGLIPVPKESFSIFGKPLPSSKTSFWRAAFTFLNNSKIRPEIFLPLSRMTEEELTLVSILRHAVAREQRLRLYDYGPMVVLAVIKEYLMSLPRPLIELDNLPLPLKDTNDYVQGVLSTLPRAHMAHLDDLLSYCQQAADATDIRSISRSLGPSVTRVRRPSKEEHAISARFVRTLIDQWPMVYDTDLKPKELPTTAPRQPAAKKPHHGKALAEPDSDSSTGDEFADYGDMPRDLPSEIGQNHMHKKRPKVPNRKAFGKVAEIMKIYDENHFL